VVNTASAAPAPPRITLLRALGPCDDAGAAAALQARLAARLARHGGVPRQDPEPVPTWPGWFECTFELPLEAFDAVLAEAGAGWTHGGDALDRSSVWNAGEGAALLDPGVAWAELLTAPLQGVGGSGGVSGNGAGTESASR
jgi:hypothetical protein